jgi:hypothetical protein
MTMYSLREGERRNENSREKCVAVFLLQNKNLGLRSRY